MPPPPGLAVRRLPSGLETSSVCKTGIQQGLSCREVTGTKIDTAQAWYPGGTSLLLILGSCYYVPLCPDYFVSSHSMTLLMYHLAHFVEDQIKAWKSMEICPVSHS